jgi:RNA polymerase sigma-70 factor, ECF subfamily
MGVSLILTARRQSLPLSEIEQGPSLEWVLVTRAREGDASAFRAIFERYAPAVRRFLADLLGDPAAADEATQETFVRAHGRLDSVRNADRLLSWLFGIARMISLEQLRSRRRLALVPAETSAEADPAPTPEAAMLSGEADSHLSKALSALPEDRRAALLLRVDHGLGYDEIATLLGWSLSKVKNEIHRARLKLREQLAGYLGGNP